MGARADEKTVLLMLAGLLLLLAGVFQVMSYFPLADLGIRNAVALALVAPGVLLLIAGLTRVRHKGSAFLLALALGVLVVVSSGLTAILVPGRPTRVVVREVTTSEVWPVEEVHVSLDVQAGALEIYTTHNRSLLVRVEFCTSVTQEPVFEYSVANGVLHVRASCPQASACIIVADWLPWSLSAETHMGAVEGDVNATCLRELVLETSMGSISMGVLAEELIGNCTVRLETSMGSLNVSAITGPEVGCLLEARTHLGSLDHEEEGYEVLSAGRSHIVLRSEGYEEASAFLHVSAETHMGSVEVRAERRA